jgi:predicted permease
VTYKISSIYWSDDTRNILATSAGTGNSGYFMLPIAAALFDDHTLSIYMMAIVGMSVYESSIGYYMCARSVSSTRDSLMKVLKLPMLNAFAFGCLMSLSGITIPDFLDDFLYGMRSAFSILGMIMIGLGLSTISKFEIDIKFTAACLLSKFLLYPIAINLFIAMDRFLFEIYDESTYDALQLMSMVPLAANTIVFASIWKLNPERMAATVLISSIFALFYIPVMAGFFIKDLS